MRMLSLVILLIQVLFHAVKAQVGTSICACNPTTIAFTLNFALTCDDTNLSGDGLDGPQCDIASASGNTVPARVDFLEVKEFNQIGVEVASLTLSSTLLDGESFTFTSSIENPSVISEPDDVPLAIEVRIEAVNFFGDPIVLLWSSFYSNGCTQYPVFNSGDQIGWTEFVSAVCHICSEYSISY